MAAQGNLIANGSFEQGTGHWMLSHDYVWKKAWDNGAENLFPSGYNYGGGVYLTYNAQDGSRLVNVNSATLCQIMNVVPGQEYELAFFVGSYDDGTVPTAVTGWGLLDLVVLQGDSLAGSLTPIMQGFESDFPPDATVDWVRYYNNTPGSHSINWERFYYRFVASGPQAAFFFQGGGYTESLFTGLDHVTLGVVPEPGTLSLCLTGGIGVLCFGIRRRRPAAVG